MGDPPWENPRIEVYVAPGDSRAQVAHAIAHELGHMRHTVEPTIAGAWLAVRRLPADTPWTVWAEDYAECFAAAFGPPVPGWVRADPASVRVRPGGAEAAVLRRLSRGRPVRVGEGT